MEAVLAWIITETGLKAIGIGLVGAFLMFMGWKGSSFFSNREKSNLKNAIVDLENKNRRTEFLHKQEKTRAKSAIKQNNIKEALVERNEKIESLPDDKLLPDLNNMFDDDD